jgi:poly(beta-D-mannuronate) lyase
MKRILIVLACLAGGLAQAGEILVRSQDAYRDALKAAKAGDTIVLANGDWRDFEVLFTGRGTAERPITLTAETRGKVILTGQSNLRLAGEYLVVSGLVFRDGHTPTNTVIAFRRTKGEYANHSRVTGVVIDHFNNPERFEEDYWVMLYGAHNRFDHSHLGGKSNKGVTMAVRLDSELSRQNHHRIDHNYFGPRPVLGSNGGETLRIGTSHHSLADSVTVVENNWFDRCDGEVEIISNKSGGNVFRGNLFTESRGTLTLRHGNGNMIENNVFLGNGVPHTGGIRVINKRQTVRNNYLHGLTGHRFGAALTIMNGVPNSPINRYHQVEDSLIEHNSIIASEHIELAAGADEERSAPPKSTVFRNNLVYNADGRNIVSVHDDVSGIEFAGNVVNDVADPAVSRGFESRRVELEQAPNGLWYPVDTEGGASRSVEVLDRASTGVEWYPKPGPDDRFDTGRLAAAAVGTLAGAVSAARAGDVIELSPGTHVVERLLVIDRPLTFRSADAGDRARLEFERTALFEIADGGSLKLVGLDISGKSAPDSPGNTVIRTSRYSMLHNYLLTIDDVTVSDLDVNHSFNFFTVAKHTFADRITIAGSTFRNITGHVLFMNRETDDLGIYNGEYVTITESTFENVEGTVADVYRGGTDESTFGPHFALRGSRLQSVGNGSRNKAEASIRLHGVQAIDIRDNAIADSRPIRVTRTVGEPIIAIADNDFVATAKPEIRDH